MNRNKRHFHDSEYAAVLTGVSHRYANRPTQSLSGIDLIIRHGERVAVIGRSGAGKSTLLTLLDGRLKGWSGGAVVLSTALDPQRPPSREQRAKTGYIFQEFALVERESARANVLNGRLGLVPPIASLFRRFAADDRAKAEAALSDAGIAELGDHRVDQLSGGQRQRVAIARCLAQEPQLILADEPVSNLDPARAETILSLLGDLARKRGAALLFSSHQPQLALRHADRVIALDGGRIVFDGAPELMDQEALDRLYGEADQVTDEPGLRLVS